MKTSKKGQSLWEIVLLLSLFCGIFLYMDFKKQTESNQFRDQSQQHQLTDHCTGLINIGCGSRDTGDKKTPLVAAEAPESVVTESTTPSLADVLGVSKEQLAKIGHVSSQERWKVDLIIILVIMTLGGHLDALGGKHWLFCRRWIMPFLLGVGVSAIIYSFFPVWYSFLAIFAVYPMAGTLTLPYSGDGNFGRAVWLLINAIVGGLFLTLVTYFCHAPLLFWWIYLIYVILAAVWGGRYRLWSQFPGDWITGSLGLCSLIFYVYLTLLISSGSCIAGILLLVLYVLATLLFALLYKG